MGYGPKTKKKGPPGAPPATPIKKPRHTPRPPPGSPSTVKVPTKLDLELERKEKVQRLNWNKLVGTQGSGDGEDEEGAGPTTAAGWLDKSKQSAEGDLLQCQHFKDCPGCMFDRDFGSTPIMEDARGFMESLLAAGARARWGASRAAEARQEFQVLVGDVHGWRTQAKLAVMPVSKYGGVEFGLYRAGTHSVVPIPNCRVHHPAINRAVEVLRAATKKVHTTAYREEAMEGQLRYVQLAVERATNTVQLTLVWNAEDYRAATPQLQLLVKELKRQAPELWHGIWANFKTGPGNAILGRDPHRWHRCSGLEYIREAVGPQNVTFHFSPPLFRQGNLDKFSDIVAEVASWVPAGAKVCELYSGVGLLGLNVAHKAEWVRCSDVNDFLPRSFARTRAKLPVDQQQRVSFEPLSADDAVEEGQAEGANVLIVDPPRKGLDPGVLKNLKGDRDTLTSEVRRIIYVSCGFEALKRDATALCEAGWIVRHAVGHVLFPGSDHIETVAVFDR